MSAETRDDEAPLSDAELDEIEARTNAASEGPWTHSWSGHIDCAPNCGTVTFSGCRRWQDARFIAHAREDVPCLLAAVRRLRRALEARG